MKESLLDSERFRLVCGTLVGEPLTYCDSDLASQSEGRREEIPTRVGKRKPGI